MINYSKYVEELILKQEENKIIEAGTFYRESVMDVPAQTYYKIITRLVKHGKLVHLTKGVYYRPKQSRFGLVTISDNEISKHYVANNSGMVIGYQLYHQKGLTTQIAKKLEILSTALNEEKKNIRNVIIRKLNMTLNSEVISIIEMLEILQNYDKIEEINYRRLLEYMKEFANEYSEQAVEYVLAHRKYKKSTLAFLERVLSNFHVKNNIRKFLSPVSKYAIPSMKEIYGGK
ncbi:hypothetical protein [Pectinatus sottacetonis]|uniref:hypothetical protein n=1 Tax=Pectinatus sottacetonis TaxID=1002795 RepID=UPI0018C4EC7C|nr:hypothetical protein [Pectinatus sottacetonis]